MDEVYRMMQVLSTAVLPASRSQSRRVQDRAVHGALALAGVRLSTIVALLLVVSAAAPVAAQVTKPSRDDRQVALQATAVLESFHIRRARMDDSMSERFFRSFFEMLDPLKLFLLKEDVEEFDKHRTRIDDYLKQGRIEFAFDVFERFLKRVEGRFATIERMIQAEHDFSLNESIDSDREDAAYADTEKELEGLWRKNIKLQLLERITGGETLEESREALARRYRDLRRRWRQTDNSELLQLFLTAVSRVFDPHTSYLSPDTLDDFSISMRLELEGIGAALRSDDGFVVVSHVVPGGAADRDGRLQAGDRIISVAEGEDGDPVDLREMKLTSAVKLIRGKKGTKVRLEVVNPETQRTSTLVLERARVELSYSEAHGEIIEEETGVEGKSLRVGVLELPSFYSDLNAASRGDKEYKSSTRDVEKILRQFKEDGAHAVVVDLRGNSGGALTEAVEMTGLFIDQGPVVQIKHPDGIAQRSDPMPGMVWEGPLVVVIDRLSASASEIFAGAIQDYGRGIVVGDRASHGKGTVQQLLDLSALFPAAKDKRYGAMKITISQFYRASGASTQNRGVVPDIILPAVNSHREIGESELEYAIEFDKIPAVSFERCDLVGAKLLDKLLQRSEERVRASDDFGKVREDIERFVELRERRVIPLNKERFVAEYRLTPQDIDEADADSPPFDPFDRTIERDYYLNEVLAITRDLVQATS